MKVPRPTQRPLPHVADFSLGEDVDLVIGLTAAALAGNEVTRLVKSHQHQGSHLIKAGLSAAVAATALKMMHQEHQDHHENHHGRSRDQRHSQGTPGENERHHHKHHGSSTRHNQAQHRHNSDHQTDHNEQNPENHKSHHRRHSLDSINTSPLLRAGQDDNIYHNRLNYVHTSDTSQRSDYGHMIPQSQASPKATTARLAAPDNGHHHVHFSDNYD